MAQLSASLILLISLSVVLTGTFQGCEKDEKKIGEENRTCRNSCSDKKPCINPLARCLCDGSCGFVCIPQGHLCLPYRNIKNGLIIAPHGHGFLAEIYYRCKEGFHLVGDKKRSCQGDMKWSGDEPFCSKSGILCSQPTFEFPNAHLDTLPIKDEYFEGEKLGYSCDFGFYNKKGNVRITTCIEDGDKSSWSPISLDCKPKICSTPDKIQNGYYDGTNFSFGKTVEYRCNSGYKLMGYSNLVCLGDKWHSSAPQCQTILCSKPPQPKNGSVTYNEPLKYLSNASYQCDTGYILSGDRVRVCGENGEWGGKETDCVEPKCEPPEPPKNGFMRFYNGSLVNDRIEYACNPGTTAVGNISSVCIFDGDVAKWSISPPICTQKLEKNCDCSEMNLDKSLEIIGNCIGQVESGENFTLDCASEYQNIIGDNAMVKCKDGNWYLPSVRCEAPCFTPDIKHGAVFISLGRKFAQMAPNIEISVGDKIMIVCEEGYELEPHLESTNGIVVCMDGKFSVIPRCKPIYEEKSTYSSRTSTNSYKATTFAHFAATTESPVSSTQILTTKPTTQTTRQSLTTTEKKELPSDECISMSSTDFKIHENGVELRREKTSFPSSTSLVFRCRNSFNQKLSGINKIQCINGNWSHPWPSCDKIYANDWYSPPPVSVSSDINVILLDNGDYLLSRGARLYFLCFFYHAQPEMYINNVLVKKNVHRNEGDREDNTYWYVDIWRYYSAAVVTFKCYVPRFNKDERYSNSVTARIGDSCFLSNDEKERIKTRFPGLVFSPLSLRPIYAEGDIVNFGCNKTVARSRFIPEGIRCATHGIWAMLPTNKTQCS